MRKKSDRSLRTVLQGAEYQALQERWYAKLAQDGFEDAEDVGVRGFEDGRPLKRWSGISNYIPQEGQEGFDILDLEMSQPPESPIISSWPEPLFSQEETFRHHPEFRQICITLCRHGNSACTPETAIAIWSDYCSGDSCRTIENRYGISDSTISRITQKLTEWMNMIESKFAEEESVSRVVIREFVPDSDSAFLYSSWRNNLWFDEERDPHHSHRFFSLATKAIKKLMATPAVKVNVACLSDDPDLIVGYSLFIGTNLEWVYVKIEYRDKGIARLLTRGLETISQPATKIGKAIAESHSLKIKENPYGKKHSGEPTPESPEGTENKA